MTKSVEHIADELRAASGGVAKTQEILARYFAESVEIRHVPANPADGAIPGQVITEVSRREVEAAARALTDRDETGSEVTVNGDVIHVRGRTRGTLPDGAPIELRTSTRFTVVDGAIVALESDMDPASAETWRKVLAAGGFELPTDLLAR